MRALVIAFGVALAGWGCGMGGGHCPSGAEGRGSTPPFGRAYWCETSEGVLHGRQMVWYRHGHLLASAEFLQGELDGRLKLQSRRGWRHHELDFQKGELHGRVARWLPGNHKVFEGHYEAGLREGEWTTWYPDGGLRSHKNYRGDLLHGELRHWSESGTIRVEGQYAHGRPVGQWVWRDEAGHVQQRITYSTSAVVERYTDGAVVERQRLSDPEAIHRAEQAPQDASVARPET